VAGLANGELEQGLAPIWRGLAGLAGLAQARHVPVFLLMVVSVGDCVEQRTEQTARATNGERRHLLTSYHHERSCATTPPPTVSLLDVP
jgi:hypothetical protein